MRNTFTLGRIRGIPIGVHWTWIPVFGLFVWSLATGVFPSTNPGFAAGAYLAMGIAATVLFFVSLLLHELGHALRAQREGVEIDSITLWLLGGVARLRRTFPTAGAEFRIAMAGPAVTAVLAAVFVAAAALTHLSAPVDAVLAWLGYINAFLLVFNLLPALPLDGGRLFRSAMWRLKGDHAWATRIAAATSVGIGALMIGAGAVSSVMTASYAGIWLAIIGWFLIVSARVEFRLASLEDALKGFVVSDLMSHRPVVAHADQTVHGFIASVPAGDRSSAYPVLDGARPVGILKADLEVPAGDRRSSTDSDSIRVADRMVALGHTPLLSPGEAASDALRAMIDADADNALVLEDGRLAGIVSSADIDDALTLRSPVKAAGDAKV